MPNPTDMSSPVTHGQLRTELGELEARIDIRIVAAVEASEQRLASAAIASEQRLSEKIASSVAASEQRLSLEIAATVVASEQRLSVELARHVTAMSEAVATQLSVIDEKYRDLPLRVTRLEDTVYKPTRRRKSRA